MCHSSKMCQKLGYAIIKDRGVLPNAAAYTGAASVLVFFTGMIFLRVTN